MLVMEACRLVMCVADALPSALCAFVGGYASISAFHLRHLRSHALLPRSACVEWRETTVHHHRACFGVKNRRYTRLRKAFTAWRQASHITQNVPEEFLNFWKEVKDMKYKWYLCIKK